MAQQPTNAKVSIESEEEFKKRTKAAQPSPGPVRQYGHRVMTYAEAMLPELEKGMTTEAAKELRKTKKGVGKVLSEEDLITIPDPNVPPPMAAKWSPAHLAQTLNALAQTTGKLTPLDAILRDKRDPHFKEGGGAGNLFSYAMTWNSASKDADAYKMLAQLNHDQFTREEINRVRQALIASNKFVLTNGPHTGLMARFVAGVMRPHPQIHNRDIEKYVQYVAQEYPLKEQLLFDFRGKNVPDLKWVEFDEISNYGSPFFKAKIGPSWNYAREGFLIGAEILVEISKGRIEQWINDHPALCVALLKNKFDKYEVEKLEEKIRPYYVFPFHWNYLFSAIWQDVSKAAYSFLDNVGRNEYKGSCAHKFSWSDGGAQRLYDWIVSRPPGLSCAAYSDDQLWVVRDQKGEITLITPDVEQMDASLSISFGKVARAYLLKCYGDKLDNTWKGVLELATRWPFRKTVAVGYALLYFVMVGLASGIPGTAQLDQVASAMMIGMVKEKFFKEVPKDREDVKRLLDLARVESERILGLKWKAGTYDPYPFEADKDYPGLVFLGHELRRYEYARGKFAYVPVRPYDKIVLSYVTPKGSYSREGIARIRGLMSRTIGVTASGGWFYPELYNGAMRIYSSHASQGHRPAPENDMGREEFAAKETFSVSVPNWTAAEFPERQWFARLVLPQTAVPVALASATSGAGATPKGMTLGQLMARDADEAEEQAAGSTNWADARDSIAVLAARRDPNVDVGGAKEVVGVYSGDKSQGRIPPLSAEVKKAYNKAWTEYRQARRAKMLAGSVLPAVRWTGKGRRMIELVKQWDEQEQKAAASGDLEDVTSVVDDDEWALDDETLDEMVQAREDDLLHGMRGVDVDKDRLLRDARAAQEAAEGWLRKKPS